MLVLWAILVLGGIVADLHTGALVGVWVAAGAAGAAALALLGLTGPLQVAAFALLAAALLAAVRPRLLRRRRQRPPEPSLLVGKFGTVLDPVDAQLASGRVVVEGVPYVARCAPGQGPLPAGSAARIAAVEAGDVLLEPAWSARAEEAPIP